jgi:preprotein translocase subunit SecG
VIYLFYTVHVIVCVFLILVVLLQQGKGADLSVFGGGSTQTAFGARSATTLLHKLTVTSFVLFICTTMLIGILQGGTSRSSIMSDVLEQRMEETATGGEATASEAELEEAVPVEPPAEAEGEPD